MNKLTNKDYKLIEKAKNAIKQNYDKEKYNYTVGAAVRCKNGKYMLE